MNEVERKDLPGITGGQTGTANVTIVTPPPTTPTFPQPGDPFDPLGDGKPPRHVEA